MLNDYKLFFPCDEGRHEHCSAETVMGNWHTFCTCKCHEVDYEDVQNGTRE